MKILGKILFYNINLYILSSIFIMLPVSGFSRNQIDTKTNPGNNPERYISYSPVKTGTHLLFNLFDQLFQRESKWENHSHRLPTVPELLSYEHTNTKVISIVRDVRDQLISAAKYWVEFDNIFPDHILADLNITDRDDPLSIQQVQGLIHFMLSDEWLKIENGIPSDIRNFHNSASIYLVELPCSLVIKFEHLVGEKGEGDSYMQINEIQKVTEHLGINLSIDEISYIGDNIFGNSTTFRNGVIGAWKNYFDLSLCEEFKEKFGKDLIILGYESDLNWTSSLDQ